MLGQADAEASAAKPATGGLSAQGAAGSLARLPSTASGAGASSGDDAER